GRMPAARWPDLRAVDRPGRRAGGDQIGSARGRRARDPALVRGRQRGDWRLERTRVASAEREDPRVLRSRSKALLLQLPDATAWAKIFQSVHIRLGCPR